MFVMFADTPEELREQVIEFLKHQRGWTKPEVRQKGQTQKDFEATQVRWRALDQSINYLTESVQIMPEAEHPKNRT